MPKLNEKENKICKLAALIVNGLEWGFIVTVRAHESDMGCMWIHIEKEETLGPTCPEARRKFDEYERLIVDWHKEHRPGKHLQSPYAILRPDLGDWCKLLRMGNGLRAST